MREIQAIATIRGIDSQGTFADAPMEQSLICKYKLNVARGENKWPVFAQVLQEEKLTHFSRFTHEKPRVYKISSMRRSQCALPLESRVRKSTSNWVLF